MSGRLLGPTLRPLPRVVVPRLSRLALGRRRHRGRAFCGSLRVIACSNPAVSLRQSLLSHFLHGLVPLVHRQTRVNCARLIYRLILIFLHFFDWVLRHFLKHKGALLLQLINVLFKEGLVFLILVQEGHSCLEVLSCLLVPRDHNLVEKFLLLLVQHLSVSERVLLGNGRFFDWRRSQKCSLRL